MIASLPSENLATNAGVALSFPGNALYTFHILHRNSSDSYTVHLFSGIVHIVLRGSEAWHLHFEPTNFHKTGVGRKDQFLDFARDQLRGESAPAHSPPPPGVILWR